MRQRLLGIGNDARAAWHRFHWRSEDTLALLITAIAVLVIFMVLLRP
jgi:energy-coupling factor transporter transmembrane protein EcfT